MKKWARNKSAVPPPSSSSQISSFARVFPVSWFFKPNQKGGNSEKQLEFAAPKSSGRFYSMDEDDYFLRLSFGEERIQGRKSTGGINPLRYEYDQDHEFKFSTKTECRNFNEMVSDIKKMRESRGKQRIVKTGNSSRDQTSRKLRGGFDDDEEEEEKISNLRCLKVQNSRKLMGFDDEGGEISNSRKSRRGFDDEEEKTSTLQERFSNCVSNWLEIEGRKLKELKIKSESKKTNGVIMKSHSPRTECKIRALEEKKKSRKKKKKKEQVLEGNTIFDSFAVVKSSYNPQQDFRESMMEMIRERGIESAEDLEQLLACYLTLNCEEYHDVIIKVFRQVWFQSR
ncbi:hypothetical protein ACS0TY_017927 [Phlomoides rotata]